MIHEYRTYTIHPGQLERYLELAETKVQPIRQDRYGRLIGFWYSEFGVLNQVHHIWEYDSLDHRQTERRNLFERRDWMEEFIAGAWPTMQVQDVRFMNPCRPWQAVAGRHALWEARIYRTVVGRFSAVAAAVAERPLTGDAVRAGLWTCETPGPNEVCEILAYPTAEARLADHAQADPQRLWLRDHGRELVGVTSTLLLPIGISPVQ